MDQLERIEQIEITDEDIFLQEKPSIFDKNGNALHFNYRLDNNLQATIRFPIVGTNLYETEKLYFAKRHSNDVISPISFKKSFTIGNKDTIDYLDISLLKEIVNADDTFNVDSWVNKPLQYSAHYLLFSWGDSEEKNIDSIQREFLQNNDFSIFSTVRNVINVIEPQVHTNELFSQGQLSNHLILDCLQENPDGLPSLNILFMSPEEGEYARVLNAYIIREFTHTWNDSKTGKTLTETFQVKTPGFSLYFYAETEEPEIRYDVLLQNTGRDVFTEQEYKYFKNAPYGDDLPSSIFNNRKKKEILLNGDEIFNYIGSYKGAWNALCLMEWQDLQFKEMFLNPELGKLTETNTGVHSGFISLSYSTTNLPENVSNLFNDDSTSNNIFFDLQRKERGFVPGKLNTFNTYDKKQMSEEEILLKLFGLKKILEEKFLPANIKILDITKEGIHAHLYSINQWSDQNVVFTNEKSKEIDFYAIPPESKMGDLEQLLFRMSEILGRKYSRFRWQDAFSKTTKGIITTGTKSPRPLKISQHGYSTNYTNKITRFEGERMSYEYWDSFAIVSIDGLRYYTVEQTGHGQVIITPGIKKWTTYVFKESDHFMIDSIPYHLRIDDIDRNRPFLLFEPYTNVINSNKNYFSLKNTDSIPIWKNVLHKFEKTTIVDTIQSTIIRYSTSPGEYLYFEISTHIEQSNVKFENKDHGLVTTLLQNPTQEQIDSAIDDIKISQIVSSQITEDIISYSCRIYSENGDIETVEISNPTNGHYPIYYRIPNSGIVSDDVFFFVKENGNIVTTKDPQITNLEQGDFYYSQRHLERVDHLEREIIIQSQDLTKWRVFYSAETSGLSAVQVSNLVEVTAPVIIKDSITGQIYSLKVHNSGVVEFYLTDLYDSHLALSFTYINNEDSNSYNSYKVWIENSEIKVKRTHEHLNYLVLEDTSGTSYWKVYQKNNSSEFITEKIISTDFAINTYYVKDLETDEIRKLIINPLGVLETQEVLSIPELSLEFLENPYSITIGSCSIVCVNSIVFLSTDEKYVQFDYSYQAQSVTYGKIEFLKGILLPQQAQESFVLYELPAEITTVEQDKLVNIIRPNRRLGQIYMQQTWVDDPITIYETFYTSTSTTCNVSLKLQSGYSEDSQTRFMLHGNEITLNVNKNSSELKYEFSLQKSDFEQEYSFLYYEIQNKSLASDEFLNQQDLLNIGLYNYIGGIQYSNLYTTYDIETLDIIIYNFLHQLGYSLTRNENQTLLNGNLITTQVINQVLTDSIHYIANELNISIENEDPVTIARKIVCSPVFITLDNSGYSVEEFFSIPCHFFYESLSTGVDDGIFSTWTWKSFDSQYREDIIWSIKNTTRSYNFSSTRRNSLEFPGIVVFLPEVGTYDVTCDIYDEYNYLSYESKTKRDMIRVLERRPNFIGIGIGTSNEVTIEDVFDLRAEELELYSRDSRESYIDTQIIEAGEISFKDLDTKSYYNEAYYKNSKTLLDYPILSINEEFNYIEVPSQFSSALERRLQTESFANEITTDYYNENPSIDTFSFSYGISESANSSYYKGTQILSKSFHPEDIEGLVNSYSIIDDSGFLVESKQKERNTTIHKIWTKNPEHDISTLVSQSNEYFIRIRHFDNTIEKKSLFTNIIQKNAIDVGYSINYTSFVEGLTCTFSVNEETSSIPNGHSFAYIIQLFNSSSFSEPYIEKIVEPGLKNYRIEYLPPDSEFMARIGLYNKRSGLVEYFSELEKISIPRFSTENPYISWRVFISNSIENGSLYTQQTTSYGIINHTGPYFIKDKDTNKIYEIRVSLDGSLITELTESVVDAPVYIRTTDFETGALSNYVFYVSENFSQKTESLEKEKGVLSTIQDSLTDSNYSIEDVPVMSFQGLEYTESNLLDLTEEEYNVSTLDIIHDPIIQSNSINDIISIEKTINFVHSPIITLQISTEFDFSTIVYEKTIRTNPINSTIYQFYLSDAVACIPGSFYYIRVKEYNPHTHIPGAWCEPSKIEIENSELLPLTITANSSVSYSISELHDLYTIHLYESDVLSDCFNVKSSDFNIPIEYAESDVTLHVYAIQGKSVTSHGKITVLRSTERISDFPDLDIESKVQFSHVDVKINKQSQYKIEFWIKESNKIQRFSNLKRFFTNKEIKINDILRPGSNYSWRCRYVSPDGVGLFTPWKTFETYDCTFSFSEPVFELLNSQEQQLFSNHKINFNLNNFDYSTIEFQVSSQYKNEFFQQRISVDLKNSIAEIPYYILSPGVVYFIHSRILVPGRIYSNYPENQKRLEIWIDSKINSEEYSITETTNLRVSEDLLRYENATSPTNDIVYYIEISRDPSFGKIEVYSSFEYENIANSIEILSRDDYSFKPGEILYVDTPIVIDNELNIENITSNHTFAHWDGKELHKTWKLVVNDEGVLETQFIFESIIFETLEQNVVSELVVSNEGNIITQFSQTKEAQYEASIPDEEEFYKNMVWTLVADSQGALVTVRYTEDQFVNPTIVNYVILQDEKFVKWKVFITRNGNIKTEITNEPVTHREFYISNDLYTYVYYKVTIATDGSLITELTLEKEDTPLLFKPFNNKPTLVLRSLTEGTFFANIVVDDLGFVSMKSVDLPIESNIPTVLTIPNENGFTSSLEINQSFGVELLTINENEVHRPVIIKSISGKTNWALIYDSQDNAIKAYFVDKEATKFVQKDSITISLKNTVLFYEIGIREYDKKVYTTLYTKEDKEVIAKDCFVVQEFGPIKRLLNIDNELFFIDQNQKKNKLWKIEVTIEGNLVSEPLEESFFLFQKEQLSRAYVLNQFNEKIAIHPGYDGSLITNNPIELVSYSLISFLRSTSAKTYWNITTKDIETELGTIIRNIVSENITSDLFSSFFKFNNVIRIFDTKAYCTQYPGVSCFIEYESGERDRVEVEHSFTNTSNEIPYVDLHIESTYVFKDSKIVKIIILINPAQIKVISKNTERTVVLDIGDDFEISPSKNYGILLNKQYSPFLHIEKQIKLRFLRYYESNIIEDVIHPFTIKGIIPNYTPNHDLLLVNNYLRLNEYKDYHHTEHTYVKVINSEKWARLYTKDGQNILVEEYEIPTKTEKRTEPIFKIEEITENGIETSFYTIRVLNGELFTVLLQSGQLTDSSVYENDTDNYISLDTGEIYKILLNNNLQPILVEDNSINVEREFQECNLIFTIPSDQDIENKTYYSHWISSNELKNVHQDGFTLYPYSFSVLKYNQSQRNHIKIESESRIVKSNASQLHQYLNKIYRNNIPLTTKIYFEKDEFTYYVSCEHSMFYDSFSLKNALSSTKFTEITSEMLFSSRVFLLDKFTQQNINFIPEPEQFIIAKEFAEKSILLFNKKYRFPIFSSLGYGPKQFDIIVKNPEKTILEWNNIYKDTEFFIDRKEASISISLMKKLSWRVHSIRKEDDSFEYYYVATVKEPDERLVEIESLTLNKELGRENLSLNLTPVNRGLYEFTVKPATTVLSKFKNGIQFLGKNREILYVHRIPENKLDVLFDSFNQVKDIKLFNLFRITKEEDSVRFISKNVKHIETSGNVVSDIDYNKGILSLYEATPGDVLFFNDYQFIFSKDYNQETAIELYEILLQNKVLIEKESGYKISISLEQNIVGKYVRISINDYDPTDYVNNSIFDIVLLGNLDSSIIKKSFFDTVNKKDFNEFQEGHPFSSDNCFIFTNQIFVEPGQFITVKDVTHEIKDIVEWKWILKRENDNSILMKSVSPYLKWYISQPGRYSVELQVKDINNRTYNTKKNNWIVAI